VPETQPSRAAFLRERVEAGYAGQRPTTFPVPFRQHQEDLVKIEVPIEFPLYNLRSGRTHRAQALYIERHGLPDDFFTDPESPDAQTAQYEILLELIDERDLAEDLLDKGQRNPIVLTYDGYIVDGNRRTAALRHEGETENLSAVVLPVDATASEVYETELELQMARQTKAEYNWIDEALHIDWGVRELGEPIDAIARRMNQKDKDIQDLLGRLALVDLYLEWLGAPGKYHRVSADRSSAAEQAFLELFQRESRAQFRNLTELHKRTIRHACFTVIDQGGGYMDIRRVADSIRSRPAEVVRRVKQELPPELSERLDQPYSPAQSPGSGDGTGSSVLDQLADVENTDDAPAGAELLHVVEQPQQAPVVAPVITRVAEELAEETREREQHLDAVRKVERALRLLQDVELSDETQRVDDIARGLEQIMAEADRLAAAVERLRAAEE
jgi:hypothetical protein